jgi:group I intron endonuclease
VKACGIYLIANPEQPLFYIGQAIDIRMRWAGHRYTMRHGWQRRCNQRLFNSWTKYGEEAFRFEILELCAPEKLTEREAYWVREFRDIHGLPVANFVGPTDNPMRGAKHRPESIAKMAAFQKGRPKSPEHRARIGAAHKGRKLSPQAIQKLREAKCGKPNLYWLEHGNPNLRPENRERMRTNNPACRPEVKALTAERTRRPVRDTASGTEWQSLSECAAELGVSVAAVSACASKRRDGAQATCRGRHLEFV